jgi:nanoRNase/pAp phosphatase (c-di-AMP/oligoRNAs hydrolase)
MIEFKEARKYIKKANKIYIVGHTNPDGDSIGASFSLCLAL